MASVTFSILFVGSAIMHLASVVEGNDLASLIFGLGSIVFVVEAHIQLWRKCDDPSL